MANLFFTVQGDEKEGSENVGIGEGGCEEETIHCISLIWEIFRFTMPPAVAILNYSSGTLSRNF
jgi:hypothetical protein